MEEYPFRKGDRSIVDKIVELTHDLNLANALYKWSLSAKEDEYKGFYKENEYSGEIEIVTK